MESLDLANEITEIIVDKMGEDTLILDLHEVTTFADYFVISTMTSRRQLDAVQSAIRSGLKQGAEYVLPKNIEGEPNSGWVLLDYNSVIVHLFTADTRAYYNLEELWKNGRVVTRIQ